MSASRPINKILHIFIFFILAGLLFSPCDIAASGEKKEEAGSVTGRSSFLFPIRFFRQYLSGADGDRCSMFPSCSKYAMDAIEKHGGITGWIMTCDRLMRCGRDEVSHSPVIEKGHRFFTYDPVENNDFWWKSD
ncbi:MAG: membrane protein insertion efficiency factor YidD [Pseudomonadota bacterium]